MTFTKNLIGAAALLATSALAGNAVSAAEFKATVVMAQTGGAAFVGVPAVNAMKLAQQDLEEQGFWGDNTFSVTYEDNRTDKQEAITLLNRVAADEEMLMYIGPVASSEALAVGPAANDLGITMYTTGTNPDILASGDWAFKSAENAEDFVVPLGEFIATKIKPSSCYLISIRDNIAYVKYSEAFAKGLDAGATSVSGEDTILSTDSDFTALATKIVSSESDCIYVSTPPEVGANLIVQLRQAGMPAETVIASTQNAASPSFFETGGSAVEGTYIIAEFSPNADSEITADFVADYTEAYGQAPDSWAAVGYSMMMVAAHSIKAAADEAGGVPSREQVRNAMASATDIPVVIGEEGKYSVGEGRVPTFGAVILQLRDGKAVKPE